MRRRLNIGDTAFTALNYTFLTLLAAVTLYPFVWVLSASFSAPQELIQGKVWLLPRSFNVEAYKIVLNYSLLWTAYLNTIFYVVVGTTLNVVLTFMAAYPLSRSRFYGRDLISFIIIFTMFFGGGMIPTFLVVRGTHLLNTRWAMIIPGAISAWNLIMTRTYLSANIPDELVEAAQIDGANDLQILWKVVTPLSLPVLAVIALFYAVGHWNEFFSALIYLRDRQLMPLQVILRQIVIIAQIDEMFVGMQASERALISETIKYATIIVATAPILVLYPFLQKYFVKGIMIGALKG
jgi:ABC-type glycerol-3-phosphate transport system permease component